MQCLRRQPGPRPKVLLEPGPAGIELQFISGSEYHSQYFRPPRGRVRRAVTPGRALKAGIALLALALAGVSAWGLAESIWETDHTVPSFWAIVDTADAKVGGLCNATMLVSAQTYAGSKASQPDVVDTAGARLGALPLTMRLTTNYRYAFKQRATTQALRSDLSRGTGPVGRMSGRRRMCTRSASAWRLGPSKRRCSQTKMLRT